ncbi:hypothetical protein [Pseudomonas umsongensis]|uniref:hypothetical protein n=1 Tax=Pseudomonas umsongensis TaxID=198618 RepID=UPI000367F591|nr:hypothetical protein [Pseudomonas umsongensis]
MNIDTSHFHRQSMSRLSYVGEYLEREGYNLNGTRVQHHLKIVRAFLDTSELTDEEAWALVELNELYVIIKVAERRGGISREEISICLKGVHYLADETSNSSGNKARNFCFQLYVISNMLAFGMKVDIPSHGEEADIRFMYDDVSVPVECKRLFAERGVEKIAKKTCSQVSKRVSKGNHGIAALSLSREFWTAEEGAVTESIQDARDKVERLYGQWRNTLAKVLKQYPKVALIYINIQFPYIGTDNLYCVYERKFFRTRSNYIDLPGGGVAQHFIESMMTLGLMEEISHDDQ